MSKVIDERVVEMQFDNKDFEKNVDVTIKSLENLKKALNIDETTKQVNNISKSLTNLEKSITNSNLDKVVTKKFSFIGTLLDQLTRNFSNKIFGLVDSTVSSAISGGAARAQKLADANFMLKGILGDTADAAAQLDTIMQSVGDSVDGTAYSLDAAASVAAQLAATGMRGGEEMTNTLKGIAGTAAMTSSSFEEIGMIYTKVMAKGHLMGDQVNQLAYRGLNVTEELAKAMGKTGDEITKMISKGQIDFKTFSDALYNAFGEHAAKANDTYAGSLANLHSAFNRITADIQAAKFEALKNVFNALRPLVNQFKKDLKPTLDLVVLLEKAFGSIAVSILNNPLVTGIVTDAANVINNAFQFLVKIVVRVRRAFVRAFPTSSLGSIKRFSSMLVTLTDKLLYSEKVLDVLEMGFSAFFKIISGGINLIKNFNGVFSYIPAIAVTVYTALMKVTTSIQSTFSNIKSVGDVFNTLARGLGIVLGGIVGTITQFVSTITGLFSGMKEETEEANGVVMASFSNTEKVVRTSKLHDIISFLTISLSEFSIKAHNAGETIKAFLSKLNLGYALIVAFSISILSLLRSIRKFIGTLKKSISPFSELAGVFKETKKTLAAYRKQLKGAAFRQTAIGIAILAASLATLILVLKDVDVKRIWHVAGALTMLAVAVTMLSAVSDGSRAGEISAGMTMMSVALVAISAALVVLNQVDVNDTGALIKRIGALVIVFGMLVGVLHIMRGLYNSNIKEQFAVIIALSLALYTIAKSLSKLNEVKDRNLDKKVRALATVFKWMIVLVGAMEILGMMKTEKTGFLDRVGMVATILAISFAVNKIITILSTIPYDRFKAVMQKFDEFEVQIGIGVAAAIGIGYALSQLGKAIANIGRGIAEFAAGVLFITTSIWLIKDIPFPTLIKSMIAVSAIGAALYYLVKHISELPSDASEKLKGAGKVFLALGAMVFAMSFAMTLLTLVKPELLAGPAVAIAGILVMVAGIVERCRGVKDAAPVIRALSVLMVVMSLMMTLLAMSADFALNDPKSATAFYSSWLLVIGMLGMIGHVMGQLQSIKIGKNAAATIDAITVMMLTVIGGVVALSVIMGQSEATLAAGAVAFGGIIVVLLMLDMVVQHLHNFTAKKLDTRSIQNTAEIIAVLITVVGSVIALTEIMSKSEIAFAAGVASFVLLIGVIGVLGLVVTEMHKLSSKQIDKRSLSTIGALGVMLALIVGMADSLAHNNWKQIAVTLLGVAGIMYEFYKLTSIMAQMSASKNINLKLITLIAAFGVSITAMIWQMSKLAAAPIGNIVTTVGAIGLFLAEFAGVIAALNKVNMNPISAQALISIIAIAGSLGIITSLMAKIAVNDWQSINSAAGSIAVVLGALAVAAVIVAQIRDTNALVGAAIMLSVAGSLALLGQALSPILQYDWEKIRNTIIAMSIAIGVLTGIVTGLGVVAGSSEVIAVGIAVVAAALVSLGVVFVSVGASVAMFGLGIKMLTEAFNVFATNCPTYAANIATALQTIATSIEGFINTASNAISTGLANIANGIVNAGMILTQGMFNIGTWVPKSLASGLLSGVQLAISAALSLASAIENTIRNILDVHSMSPKFIGIAKYVGQSLVSGLFGSIGPVSDASTVLATAIESGPEAAKAKMNATGTGIVGNLIDGLMSGKSGMAAAGQALMKAFTSQLGGLDSIGSSLSNVLGGALGGSDQKIKRSSEQLKSLYKAAKNTGADSAGLLGAMTLGGDWQTAMEIGAEGAENLTSALGDLTDTTGDAAKGLGGAGSAAKAAGEDAKHSLKSWQELGAALEDTIDSQMDIFTEFERKSDLTADQVLHNMRSQIDGVREWSRNLYELSKRGLNSVLVQELSEMGPQGYEKVNAFIQMTDEQLKEANELYAERLQMPKEASSAIVKSFAVTGMWGVEGFKQTFNKDAGKEAGLDFSSGADEGTREGLGVNSPSTVMMQIGEWCCEGLVNGLENPFWAARIKVAAHKLARIVVESINEILGKTDDSNAGQNVTDSLSDGVMEGTKKVNKTMMHLCKKIMDTLKKYLPENTFHDFGYMIWDQFSKGMDESYKNMTEVLNKQLKKMEKDYKKAFVKLGEYSAEGLSEGIEKKLKKVTDSIVKVCESTIDSAKKTIKSRSPSRVFMEIGENITVGLANGITDKMSVSATASQKMAAGVISSFQNAVDSAGDLLQQVAQPDMVLTPVLDLTQVEADAKSLNSIMGTKNLHLATGVNPRALSGYFRNQPMNPEPVQQITNNTYEFTQNNTSPKALSNAEIYRQTNNLISRYRKGE